MIHAFSVAGNKKDAGQIAKDLEAQYPGLKLHADKEDDEVHGYVSVCGDYIEVGFYDSDEGPTTGHKSSLKNWASKPSKASLESVLHG